MTCQVWKPDLQAGRDPSPASQVQDDNEAGVLRDRFRSG